MQTIIIAVILLLSTSFSSGEDQQIFDRNFRLGICRRSGTTVSALQVNLGEWNDFHSMNVDDDCWYCLSGFDCSRFSILGNMCNSNDVMLVGTQLTCIGLNGNINTINTVGAWNTQTWHTAPVRASTYGSRVGVWDNTLPVRAATWQPIVQAPLRVWPTVAPTFVSAPVLQSSYGSRLPVRSGYKRSADQDEEIGTF